MPPRLRRVRLARHLRRNCEMAVTSIHIPASKMNAGMLGMAGKLKQAIMTGVACAMITDGIIG